MKKQTFISVIILLLALLGLTRCKLAEVETIEEIPCPGVGIDTVHIPGWDDQEAKKYDHQDYRPYS